MEETSDDQTAYQNQNNETYEETYNSLNATIEKNSNDTLMNLAVQSISNTEPKLDCQTMNVTILKDTPIYNPDFTNHEATKEKMTKIEEDFKQLIENIEVLSKTAVQKKEFLEQTQNEIDTIEKQNLSAPNTIGNPMRTRAIPSTSQSLPIETITIKEEMLSENEEDPPSQTMGEKDRERNGTQCPICNCAVQNELMLNAHLKKYHKMPPNPKMPQTNPPNSPSNRHPPKIICQVCHIIIESQFLLEEHMSNEHGCKIRPQKLTNINPPQMSPSTNEYKPPPACTKMNPIDLEYYRNHPWESRVRAANRRIYKTTKHLRYKEVISWIIEEIEIDLEQNPKWKIRICTRNKNTNTVDKKLRTCQWFQTSRCIENKPCHAEKKENKVHYTHACEICYRIRNALIEHPAEECELLELLDRAELGEFPDTDILWRMPGSGREYN